MTKQEQTEPQKTYLRDYQEPHFWVSKVDLDVTILDDYTEVKNQMLVQSNKDNPSTTLTLDGVNIDFVSVSLDGRILKSGEYQLEEEQVDETTKEGKLSIFNMPDKAIVIVTGRIDPKTNKSNEGLYQTGDAYLTQCEAEGFRAIAYSLDRPDVMSEYTVTITGDKETFSHMLSNGNPINSQDNGDGTHTMTWHDPSLKPSYLFALVAGQFNVIEGSFTTRSKRDVKLQIFADPDVPSSEMQFALEALHESMRYDEDRFDREYDLDIYMIAATSQFNMGAMENKGLNVFNTSVVLGSSKTATDDRLQRIADVIFHEYAHNWSGNLVTCRDWFQLSLKEGLTVFRDSQFNADHTSHAIKRIEDVKTLRAHQFAEDASPKAHPIRPHFFTTINNFYTMTVYEKGAEIIYMIYSMLGKEGFKQALNLYFSRHKGQAVTTEEFVKAMEDGGNIDLTQFRNWYDQGGTPLVKVDTSYDAQAQIYSITLSQSVRQLDGYPEPKPFHMPIAIGLLDSNGKNILEKDASDVYAEGTVLLHFTEETQTFTFDNIEEEPVLSFLRNFSVPVKVEMTQSNEDLLHLMAYDTDPYNKWEACDRLMTAELKRLVAEEEAGRSLVLNPSLISTLQDVLNSSALDDDLKRLMLTLPDEGTLHGLYDTVPIDAIYTARKAAKQQLATALEEDFLSTYNAKAGVDNASARGLKNLCLSYLTSIDGIQHIDLANQQYATAQNFTDENAGFANVVYGGDSAWKQNILPNFATKWQNNADVMDSWFRTQAFQDRLDVLDVVKGLMTHKTFDNSNPNKLRAVIGPFTHNHVHFHNTDGSGYAFLADEIIRINGFNPQVAARFVTPFTSVEKYDDVRQKLIMAEVNRIHNHKGMGNDVKEITSGIIKAMNKGNEKAA